MLLLRKHQLEALRQVTQRTFAQRLVTQLKQFFPAPCSALSEKQILTVIAYGFHQADSYGVSAEADLSRYIKLMFSFGLDFDTALPWAARILDPGSGRKAEFRMDDLYDEAVKRLRRNPELQIQQIQVPHGER